jgi:micrococcal nuclease
MSRKKIGLIVAGAVIVVSAAVGGGTESSDAAAVQPARTPPATQTPVPSTRPLAQTAAPSSTVSPTATAMSGTVAEVIDGDTIRVELPSGLETVRIIGIDTPEVHHPSKPEACYGVEATAYAEETLQNVIVELEVDPTQDARDKYDRLLAHVYVGDNLYAKAAIAGGYGIHYIYDRPSIHADELDASAAMARSKHLGIWAKCEGRVDLPVASMSAPTKAPAVKPAATPKPKPKATTAPKSDCHPSYSPCVPNVGHDLDCPDIGFQVRVKGPDTYRLDRDHDGFGCESY